MRDLDDFYLTCIAFVSSNGIHNGRRWTTSSSGGYVDEPRFDHHCDNPGIGYSLSAVHTFHILTSVYQSDVADCNEDMVEEWISLSFTWSGRSFTLEIAHSDRLDELQWYIGRKTHSPQRIFDLKAVLFSMTDVPPERQKILGLVKGRLPADDGRM